LLTKRISEMPDLKDVLDMIKGKNFLYMKNTDKLPIIPVVESSGPPTAERVISTSPERKGLFGFL
jgi:hypothetical protein